MLFSLLYLVVRTIFRLTAQAMGSTETSRSWCSVTRSRSFAGNKAVQGFAGSTSSS